MKLMELVIVVMFFYIFIGDKPFRGIRTDRGYIVEQERSARLRSAIESYEVNSNITRDCLGKKGK